MTVNLRLPAANVKRAAMHGWVAGGQVGFDRSRRRNDR